MHATVSGDYDVWCHAANGRLRWQARARNTVTDTARDHALDGIFSGGTVGANWFLSLVNNASFTEFDPSDTIASHAGWTEFTSYSSSTRPAWGHGSSSGGVKQNASLVTFTMTASGTLKGLFLVNQSTKGGSTGLLWATAPFRSGTRDVHTSDVLSVRCRVRLRAGSGG